ncbi:MAG: anti-sigma factor [Planctomycetes bacterium]|nr:anti-sigma factor [Planctomycetota bacterium]
MNETPIDPTMERLLDAALTGEDGGAISDTPTLRSFRDTAALATAAVTSTTPVPGRLFDRLAADALRHCASVRPRPSAPIRQFRPSRWPLVAAAAAGVLITWLVMPREAQAIDPATQRTALLADSGSFHQSWKSGPSPLQGAVSGDVVWNDQQQRGVLRLQGLPAAPEGRQFQLWIVDREREGAPVDGGLFDVSANGETLVPVQARLHIGKAAAFVITVERHGGVVVSKQEDVVAIAGL